MAKLTIESAAVVAFKGLVEKRISKYWQHNKLTIERPTVELMDGRKFIRVWVCDKSTRKTIHSFIAKDDFHDQFDDVERGDIFKPATLKAPARHARGNVSSEQLGEEAFGDGYLIRYATQQSGESL